MIPRRRVRGYDLLLWCLGQIGKSRVQVFFGYLCDIREGRRALNFCFFYSEMYNSWVGKSCRIDFLVFLNLLGPSQ